MQAQQKGCLARERFCSMLCFQRIAAICLSSVCLVALTSCGIFPTGKLSYAAEGTDPLASYMQLGDTDPILDPSIIRQGSTYYAFSTDVAGFSANGNIPIHCSQDKTNWTACGSVFPGGMPQWIQERIPGVIGLWAPDISYFNGHYHLYYNGSKLHTQQTVIGLVTNTTLDPAHPDYKWVDCGMVLQSKQGDDFNALDPTILIDSDQKVWLTYGSYWSGIKQRQIDAISGLLLTSPATILPPGRAFPTTPLKALP
jgi:arabinan endo-1,5-alpha-L-arabinosidase